MEDIADRFENSMKKGFIQTIILSLLKKEPSHGYQIKKVINEASTGLWEIQDSSLYTVLGKLTQNGLIYFQEEFDGDRKKKVYRLTEKGEELLDIISDRQNRIINSIISLLNMVIQDEKSDIVDLSEIMRIFSPVTPDLQFIEQTPPAQQLMVYKIMKEKINKLIKHFEGMTRNIERRMNDLSSSDSK